MDKQVDKSHYEFSRYMDKQRWASVWHQLDEVRRFEPDSVVEIGPGTGLFKASAGVFAIDVKTLDIAPDLDPDCVGAADAIPLQDKSVDVLCAFQVLEHMPFETSMKALGEMQRVARKGIVISLPDASVVWASRVKVPLFKPWLWMIPNPLAWQRDHVFDGEHYWEVNKRGYSLKQVQAAMQDVVSNATARTYRVHENPYHRFFVWRLDGR